jgi:hypothetical protein
MSSAVGNVLSFNVARHLNRRSQASPRDMSIDQSKLWIPNLGFVDPIMKKPLKKADEIAEEKSISDASEPHAKSSPFNFPQTKIPSENSWKTYKSGDGNDVYDVDKSLNEMRSAARLSDHDIPFHACRVWLLGSNHPMMKHGYTILHESAFSRIVMAL